MSYDRGAFIDTVPVGFTVKRVTSLPTSFRNLSERQHCRPMDEFDIRLPGSALRLKLLVFKAPKAMRAFWHQYVNETWLDDGCLGAVSSFYKKCEKPDGYVYYGVDARYYAIMGLCANACTMEIISHEAGHAAMSFARRKTRAFKARHDELPEEAWCYPLGKLTYQIADALGSVGLGPLAPATGTSGERGEKT